VKSAKITIDAENEVAIKAGTKVEISALR